jgi:DHA1 family tetracycline resistance protein-like MFS transporter
MSPVRAVSTRPASPIVLATVFVDIVGFGMILPILPGHAASLGGNPTTIGLLVGAYSAIQLLLAPFWGRVSDTIGRRPVLLIGLAGSAVSYALFALAGHWWVLLVSRLLDGGAGATINVGQAYLADATPPEERARAMGKIGAAVGLGFIVGPMLGGITAGGGVTLVAWIAAAITTMNLIVAWRFLPESVRHAPSAPIPEPAVSTSRVLLPLSVLFLSTLAFSVMYVVFPLWGEATLAVSRSTVSYWFALIGLVTAIVQGGVLGWLVRVAGETGTARCGTAFLATGLALVPLAGDAGGARFYVVLVLLGIGYGLAGPAMLGLVSRDTGASRQGRILGVAQSAASLARIIGPVLAGMVMSGAGAAAAFMVSATVAAAGLMMALVLGVRRWDAAEGRG